MIDIYIYIEYFQISQTSIKHGSKRIKLAAGLVCHHKFQKYLCVVHGWDDSHVPDDGIMVENWDSNPYKYEPFHNILLADGTENDVPQSIFF